MGETPATQFVKNDPDTLKILPDALTVEQYAIGFKHGNKELVIIAYLFDSLFMAVNSGKVDIICAGITVNEERKMFTDFSDPYEDAKQVAVVLTKDYKAE